LVEGVKKSDKDTPTRKKKRGTKNPEGGEKKSRDLPGNVPTEKSTRRERNPTTQKPKQRS